MIGNLCTNPDGGVNIQMFLAIQRGDIDLDEAYDLLEIDFVDREHRKAREANAKAAAEHRRTLEGKT